MRQRRDTPSGYPEHRLFRPLDPNSRPAGSGRRPRETEEARDAPPQPPGEGFGRYGRGFGVFDASCRALRNAETTPAMDGEIDRQGAASRFAARWTDLTPLVSIVPPFQMVRI
jgi:hypothetical protein